MPVEWPLSLPFDQVREGAAIASLSRPQRNTDFETGPPQSVRVDIVNIGEVDCAFVWTHAQHTMFKTWFKGALGLGTAWFNMPIPTRQGGPGSPTTQAYEVRYCKIVDQSVKAEDVSITHVRVTFKVQVEDL